MRWFLGLLITVVFVAGCGGGDVTFARTPKPTIPHGTPQVTTVRAIADGKFKSGINKEGNGGELVTVKNARVLLLQPNDDGDTHVVINDRTFPALITEITPTWKRKGVKIPPVGSVIDITGVTYFDHNADGEMHEFTQWEIHPVTSWTQVG